MKMKLYLIILFLMVRGVELNAQVTQVSVEDYSNEAPHSILPADGIIDYLPNDSFYFNTDKIISTKKVQFSPLVNFFFRPEATVNYKEAGFPIDTGHLNFYLRGDFGGKISLPKNIDMVFNLQSYGIYTRSLGPLDPNMSLYEAYVEMKKLDRNNRLSLRFGRMSLGKYGTEMLIGDDDFGKGRSFESVRFRFKTEKLTSDLMWVQLYQLAPPTAGFEWNHPIFLATLNTFHFSEAANLDLNLPYLIDQFNSGFRTSVFMPDVRFYGKMNSLRYTAEFIYQGGSAKGILNDSTSGNVKAYAVELGAGYFTDENKFSIDVSYYRASGDDQPGDDQLKSYNVLWQNEHRRFGYIDAFKGSNVQAGTVHMNWNVGRLISTGFHGVYASVIEPLDRSPGIATIPSLNNLTTTSKSIGVGGDIYVNYFFNHYLNMQLSGSVFSPGEYFTAVNGIDEPMVRMYLLLAARI